MTRDVPMQFGGISPAMAENLERQRRAIDELEASFCIPLDVMRGQVEIEFVYNALEAVEMLPAFLELQHAAKICGVEMTDGIHYPMAMEHSYFARGTPAQIDRLLRWNEPAKTVLLIDPTTGKAEGPVSFGWREPMRYRDIVARIAAESKVLLSRI